MLLYAMEQELGKFTLNNQGRGCKICELLFLTSHNGGYYTFNWTNIENYEERPL